jgi:hypothetical protein
LAATTAPLPGGPGRCGGGHHHAATTHPLAGQPRHQSSNDVAKDDEHASGRSTPSWECFPMRALRNQPPYCAVLRVEQVVRSEFGARFGGFGTLCQSSFPNDNIFRRSTAAVARNHRESRATDPSICAPLTCGAPRTDEPLRAPRGNAIICG